MRNELLNGFVIHHRKYREKSYIVHMLSEQYGRVDGILRQTPPPQYQHIQLYATGKHELKHFSHLELNQPPVFLTGDAFFIGFYINELLFKLTSPEHELPTTFQYYQYIIKKLHTNSLTPIELHSILRQFETALLQDLGYHIEYHLDTQQNKINAKSYYQFYLNEGFVLSSVNNDTFQGCELLSMQNPLLNQTLTQTQLKLLRKLYQQIFYQLLDGKPLKSRQLWIQHKQRN